MVRKAVGPLSILFLVGVLLAPMGVYAQREQEIPPPDANAYGSKFFDQLRSVFGRFRDADLQRAFEAARPIPCSELTNGKGEWRPVAFFNENRKLGEWYRSTFEEVQQDIEVYTFKGLCSGTRGAVQVVTKFPVGESIDAYNAQKIGFKDIDINVNAPVSVIYDPRTQAYAFDLPYLFLVDRQDGDGIYSLIPPRLVDRTRYATDVMDHWDCKAVNADDVTYQFLICRTTTVSRNPVVRSQQKTMSFGASAYFILSDGKEAASSVKLSFGDAPDPNVALPRAAETSAPVPDRFADKVPDIEPAISDWQIPDSGAAITDLGQNEFRLRFNTPAWTGKIGSPQILVNQKMSSMLSTSPPANADYCTWRPGATAVSRVLDADPDAYVTYSVTSLDRTRQTPLSVAVDLKSHTGLHLGALQCFFPGVEKAAGVTFFRWSSIVGGNLILEIRP